MVNCWVVYVRGDLIDALRPLNDGNGEENEAGFTRPLGVCAGVGMHEHVRPLASTAPASQKLA